MTQDTTPTSGAADLPEALIHAGMQALLQCTASELENLSPTLFEGYAGDVQRVFVAMTGKALSAALSAGQATAAQAGAPANMQVTEKMRAAGDCAWMTADCVDSARVFRAMLSAAPAQPAAPPSGKTYEVLIHDLEVIASTTLHATVEGSRRSYERDAVRQAIGVIRASHGQAPAPEDSVQGDALSDAVRVPLDSLHADADYLIGRLRDGSMPYDRVIEIIRERIDAAIKQGATT